MDWRNKRCLIGGGAGMIGSHLARELLGRGASVAIADNLSGGSEKNIADIINDVEFLQYDLRVQDDCVRAVGGAHIVFQLAANMGGIGYISSIGAEIMHDSALININMLEAVQKEGVDEYFYSSSACIYPEYKQTSEDVEPLKESDAYPAMPDQFYGWEKLFSEKLCEAYARDHDMNIRVARFHNVYGPIYTAFDKDKGKAPCHLILKAIKHPEPPFDIWGDGRQTRSFLFIDDCVEAILRLMASAHKEPINIGSDRLISINGLAEICIALSGKPIEPVHDYGKPQGVRGRNASLDLVQKVLKWQPQVTLEDGMRRTYEWAVNHYKELLGV